MYIKLSVAVYFSELNHLWSTYFDIKCTFYFDILTLIMLVPRNELIKRTVFLLKWIVDIGSACDVAEDRERFQGYELL
jgi:hypothetical protein